MMNDEGGIVNGEERDRHRLFTGAVCRKILPLPAPLLDKEGLGEVLSSVKNPPRSPLGKGGRKQAGVSGNRTSYSSLLYAEC